MKIMTGGTMFDLMEEDDRPFVPHVPSWAERSMEYTAPERAVAVQVAAMAEDTLCAVWVRLSQLHMQAVRENKLGAMFAFGTLWNIVDDEIQTRDMAERIEQIIRNRTFTNIGVSFDVLFNELLLKVR